jgi:hypothetical protein
MHSLFASSKIRALTPQPEHSGQVAAGGILAAWYQDRSSAFAGSMRRRFVHVIAIKSPDK